METSYGQVSWSRSELLVNRCQTFYPRILPRVQPECKGADFKVSFCRDDIGLRCFVCFFVGDVIREVCLHLEQPAPGFCNAENKCLSRALAILLANQSSVSVHGCSSTLINIFTNWCKAGGRYVPLHLLEYTPNVFKEHVCDAGVVGANLLDPFAILHCLLRRLVKAVHQLWLMALPQFIFVSANEKFFLSPYTLLLPS